jgi:hypothetical protein
MVLCGEQSVPASSSSLTVARSVGGPVGHVISMAITTTGTNLSTGWTSSGCAGRVMGKHIKASRPVSDVLSKREQGDWGRRLVGLSLLSSSTTAGYNGDADNGGVRASLPAAPPGVIVSDTTAILLSGLIGLIGAILGGALSLTGSIIVNRRERRAALRYEVYRIAADLVPRMDEAPSRPLSERHDETAKQLDTMARLGAIAGRDERRLTAEVQLQWLQARNAAIRGDASAMTSHLTNASNALDELLKLLQEKLD